MKKQSPWSWVPTLYFAEGLPYIAVMTLSLVMYKRMGISNTEVALYTSWLNLPWVIKPLWSPFVDLLRTKRWWVTLMQLFIGAGLAGIAFTIPTEHFFQATLAIFWLMAFSSATHDIAADGFYMLGLTTHEQALFVGIRSTFYRIATIAGQGLLVMIAGYLEKTTGSIPYSWSITFLIMAGIFLALWLYHAFILPRPANDKAAVETSASGLLKEFLLTFRSFFRKEQAGIAILFMLLYRLPEAQLTKMSIPFLLDPVSEGGLGIYTRYSRHYRTDVRRYIGRYGSRTARTETMAMVYGMGYLTARHSICIFKLLPRNESLMDKHMHLYRAVWLWIRFHCLHALPHLFFSRNSQYRTLCHLYSFHGPGNDASRHDSRMDAGASGIPALLPLDHGMLCCNLWCNCPTENRF